MSSKSSPVGVAVCAVFTTALLHDDLLPATSIWLAYILAPAVMSEDTATAFDVSPEPVVTTALIAVEQVESLNSCVLAPPDSSPETVTVGRAVPLPEAMASVGADGATLSSLTSKTSL